jgi:ketosteroid isomerase-like protein
VSQENVEIVRRVLDAWNRRDADSFLAHCDPEIEYLNSPTAVEPGIRRGQEELLTVLRAWEILLDAHGVIEQVFDRGEEVIAVGRISRRMPGSDARIEDRVLTCSMIRKQKIVRIEVLGFGSAEVQQALKAAGLEE